MKLKRDAENEILSLLGEGVEFHGELSFSHGIRIDGLVQGRIQSGSCLLIGPKGKVEAEAVVRRLAVDGEFRGVVRASDRVEIHREGKVYGEIYTPCLVIEAGALFEGKCNKHEGAQEAQKAQQAGA